MTTEQIQAAVYAACLVAAVELGDEIKQISWFGSNHPSPSRALVAA